jgi:uncharacterized protein (DUF885 family)
MTTAPLVSSPVDDLADRFWQDFLERQPVWATVLGDDRWDHRWDDPGPVGRADELAMMARLLRDADRIDRVDLPTEERITLDMLRVVARMRQAYHAHALWQMDAIDQMNGPQTLPGQLARFQRIDTPERLERLICRLDAYPAYLALHIDNLHEGLHAGRAVAAPSVERTITQVRRALAAPADESPLLLAHPDLPADQREAIRAAVERNIRPAFATFLAELEAYLPMARSGEGVCWLPDGDAVYRYCILASTTLEEEPQAIHDYGLAQIEAIDRERLVIANQLGFADVAAFRAALDADGANHATDGAELVLLARAQVERAQAAAPRWFGRLPLAACEVRAVEPHEEQEAPPAFYYPPSPDGVRPGIYFVNTFQPGSRPLHRLATVTYHEAVPGHHFQIAIEAELDGLPAFRRLGSRLAGAAYAEGWGLYSERLADEMGFLTDPRERFGMLDAQAWRAARLVVDTGLHAFGWGRQRSIELLRSAAGLSDLEAATETDRYITWPGQALAYMIGQREIEALRRELETRDGHRFDLRAFHDACLAHGSLPLATLRRELPSWVQPREP